MAALSAGARRAWRGVATAPALAAALALPARAGEPLELAEHKIKAGLIYNLLKYVEWPEAAAPQERATADVCVFGDDPFDGALRPMRGRTVNQREIALRQVREIDATAQCRLLFVHADEWPRWPDLAAFLAGRSVLTVSDVDAFVGSGGMVELGREGEHVKLSIDVRALNAAGLQLHDRLRKLARVVEPGARGTR